MRQYVNEGQALQDVRVGHQQVQRRAERRARKIKGRVGKGTGKQRSTYTHSSKYGINGVCWLRWRYSRGRGSEKWKYVNMKDGCRMTEQQSWKPLQPAR